MVYIHSVKVVTHNARHTWFLQVSFLGAYKLDDYSDFLADSFVFSNLANPIGPQPAELIAHLRRFATHALAVSIASYVNMCEYSLHILLVVSWFPLHQWSILKFLSFVAEKIFGPSLLPAPVADVSSSSKFMALFKVMIGVKIEPYYANIFVNLLPVSVSSQLMLHSCYHQSLAPVRGSLWKMLPAIPYMLAQSPMPADVIDQVISLFSGVEHSLEAEACPMVTSSINTVSGAQQGAPESINEDKDDFFNEEMIRHMSASSNAKPTISTAAATEADATPSTTTATADTTTDATTKTAAEPTPSATTKTAAEPTPSATTTTVADPTVDSINTFGGAHQVAPENINQDNDDIINYEEMSWDMSTSFNAEPMLSPYPWLWFCPPCGQSESEFEYEWWSIRPLGSLFCAPIPLPFFHSNMLSTPTPPATTHSAADPTPSATTDNAADPTHPPPLTPPLQQTTPDPLPSLLQQTPPHLPPPPPLTTFHPQIYITASGGKGSEASMWAPGNQAVEFDTQEEIDDLWSAFHAMKKQTKGELAATAKLMASISMAASGGEGLGASIWAPGNQRTNEEQAEPWAASHSMTGLHHIQ
ncbi:hypothetical protein BU17DRAFT_102267 [Hysterangium stoloniferum]|nr:hypothetical protein BU17DRAFT_102267 [Hysterangium stoloniferum]